VEEVGLELPLVFEAQTIKVMATQGLPHEWSWVR